MARYLPRRDAENHGGALRGRLCRHDPGGDARRGVWIGGVAVTFRPAGHVLGSAQIVVEKEGTADRGLGRLQAACRSDLPSLRARSLRRLHHRGDLRAAGLSPPRRSGGDQKLLGSVRQFPDRTYLVGAYALGKAQRVIALIRAAGYAEPIYIHGALQRLCDSIVRKGSTSAPWSRRPSRREAARFRRQDRGRPAFRLRRSLGAALRRSGVVLRLRLDAYPPARQAGRGRVAARHL